MSGAAITAVGMVSAVGLDAPSSCAAIRAGLAGSSEYADYCPIQHGPVHGELPPLVGALAGFATRPADVLARLFSSCMQQIVADGMLDRTALAAIPVIACLPPSAGFDFVGRMGFRTGATLSGAAPTSDRAGGLGAVGSALRLIGQGHPAAVVIGVHTYFELATLRALDEAGRLKSAANPDGFIPGECAAAVLLESRAAAERRGVTPLATVGEPGIAQEPNSIVSADPSTSAGLTDAIRSACGSGGEPVTWAVCDLNGESYKSGEWGNTRIRLHERLGRLGALWHPADCLGDVGSATGPALMTVAATALKKGYAPAECALLWAGSDDGTRAALMMTRA